MARPDEIVQMARSKGVQVNLFSGLDSVRTVVEASNELERDLDEVGNTVLLTVKGEPVLVIAPGDRRVDGGLVAARYDAEPLEISLATKDEVLEHTGYDVGMIPPFGLSEETDLLVDEALLEHDTVLLPTGSPDALMEVDPSDLANLPSAELGTWSVTISGEDEDEG